MLPLFRVSARWLGSRASIHPQGFAKYSDNDIRSAGILPAVAGASRSRRRGWVFSFSRLKLPSSGCLHSQKGSPSKILVAKGDHDSVTYQYEAS